MESLSGAVPIGIGVVESAITLCQLMERQRVDSLVFAGSAGSYGGHKLLEVIESCEAVQIELCSLEGQCYAPRRQELFCESESVPRGTIVNSSNYICSSSLHAKRLLSRGISAENMEFFSVLSVAQRYGIPAFGCFVITNYCHEEAHAEFLSHHAEAMLRLQTHLQQRFPELGLSEGC